PKQPYNPPRMDTRRATRIAVAGILAAPAVARIFGAGPPDACERLRAITVPNGAITEVRSVDAGAMSLPGRQATTDLPAFCRVAATLKPSSDSDIKIEVWLPQSGWNDKLEAVGNGAWSGSIPSAAMADALRRGYATAGTDTGHTGGSASFAF